MKKIYLGIVSLLVLAAISYFSYKTVVPKEYSSSISETASTTKVLGTPTVSPAQTSTNTPLHMVDIGSGYFKSDDAIYYRTRENWNALAKLEGADLATFVIVENKSSSGGGVAKDIGHVYYYGKVTDLNPKTFVLFPDGYYMKDAVSAYFGKDKIEGVDSASFVVFEEHSGVFAKDKNRVFFNGKPVEMKPAELSLPDPKSFMAMFAYAKDSTRVFYTLNYSDGPGMSVINGADAGTFQELYARNGQNLYYAIAKDKSHVYDFDQILPDVADVSTFEFVGTANCTESQQNGSMEGCLNFITKDKQCMYLNNKKVLGTDGLCVSPAQCTETTIDTKCGIQ